MGAAIGDACPLEGLLPGFFDVYTAECSPACEDEGLLGIAEGAEASQLGDDRITKSNAARASILALFDVGDFVLQIDVFPLEIEDFSLTGTGGQRDEDDAVEVGGFAAAGSREETSDFVFCEDTVATRILFEFDEAKCRIFADLAQMFGCIGEKCRE
jgi:hypothetical protein